MAFCTRAELFDSRKSRSESSASDENFEEELEEGYQSFKGEPNADDTKRLLQQLHKMGLEIKQEFTISPMREVESKEAIEKVKPNAGNDKNIETNGILKLCGLMECITPSTRTQADWATQFSKETNHTNYNYNLTYDY
uniref:Phosphoprotein n=1 Tax=Angiostrongylus cantonensis TaxID=6313 RepID=A0A0K0D736_ANGCA